jgi:hypothetical protein
MDLKDPHCIDNIRMIVTSIKVFAPFINERIIKFRTPLNYCCANCNATIETEINNYLELNIDLDADMSINILEKSQKFKMISVDNYDLMSSYDMSLLFLQIPKREQSCLAKLSVGDKVTIKVKDNSYILEQIKNLLKNYLENVLLSTFSANRTSSLFISKSTMDTLFLSSIDKNKPQQSEIEVWEAMRSINLPWVGELDISQILTLRHQASASLESLRENLSLALMQGGEKKATEVVSEITSKVTELKQEIMANDIVKRSSKRYSAAFGSLAITLVVYGLASNVPVAAIGSVAALLATLSHMRTTEKEQEEKHAKIVTSPAYALLKAQDLLSCRE